MANAKHLAILRRGPREWNAWRDAHPHLPPDLTGAKLTDAKFTGAHFTGAKLSDADLTGAHFTGADLSGADLSDARLIRADLSDARLIRAVLAGARLIRADLSDADLTDANLTDANLTSADLMGANLTGANLTGAILGEAQMNATILANVDLRPAKALDRVVHRGPSTIGIDTLYRSGGEIPIAFLRGAGVPDGLIDYVPSLTGTPLDFFSCFISHSHHDQIFCDRLYADLQAKHIRTWYFPEDAVMGRSVWGEIDRGIKVYDKLVVVCSAHSLTSRPVVREIERALQREDKEGKEVLFPIRIDDYLFHEWKHERKADVVAKVVGDFRYHESMTAYSREFDRLLRGLKASEKAIE